MMQPFGEKWYHMEEWDRGDRGDKGNKRDRGIRRGIKRRVENGMIQNNTFYSLELSTI